MFNIKFHSAKDKKLIKMYTTAKVITIILAVFAIVFVNYILANEFISAEKYMEQAVEQTASNLQGRIKNSTNEMRVLSAKLSNECTDFSEKTISTFLKQHINDYDYYKLIFVFPDGHTIRYQKGIGFLPSNSHKNDERFKKAIEGTSVFSTIRPAEDTPSGYVNEFGVPVYNSQKKIAGVIAAQIYAGNYIKILGYNNYNQNGYSYIIDKNGNFILKPLRDKDLTLNFFDRKIKLLKTTKQKILQQINENGKGVFLFKQNNEKYIAAFAIIGEQNGYVLTILPIQVLMLHIDKLLLGISFIILIFSIFLISLMYYSNKLLKKHEETIYKIAFTDNITKEGNKNKFILQAQDIITANRNSKFAMITVDITRFKAINELYGFNRANEILKDFYEILKRSITKNSICARDYAASFVILYEYTNQDFIVKDFIEKVQRETEYYNEHKMKKMSSEDENIIINAKLNLSFGIYLIESNDFSVNEMCEKAYIAQRKIKGDVIHSYKFYDETIRNELLQDKSIEDEMYKALNNKEFKMYLQPKVDLNTKELYGAEALVRWIHPEKGLIPPINFIPLFERNGFVIEVDRCIWKQACEYLETRKNEGKKLFPISVNVSRLHMNNDVFMEELKMLTQKHNIEPKYLELELTESACYNNEERFKEITAKLKEAGFTITMDDFGTGYSSLNMLRHLSVDILKLDMGFIKDTINDKKGKIVINNIITMANQLNMLTVAEGIEFDEQAEFLRNAGCKIAQGYLYGKPMPKDEFTLNCAEKLFI